MFNKGTFCWFISYDYSAMRHAKNIKYDISVIKNKIGSDTEFILMGRSFIYIMHNRGPRSDAGGTLHFNVPQLKKKS